MIHGLRYVLLPAALLLVVVMALPALPHAASAQDAATPTTTLEGFAVLPADTFAPGPPSGFAIDASNGRTPPFESQPVQGISSVIAKPGSDTYLAMSDNGFGAKANSPDYRLRWYEMAPDFSTGTVGIIGYTELSDPDNLIPWSTVNENLDRVLTGADFDLESFRLVPDGTVWLGEEFGPFLLHTDATGRLLEPPYPIPYPDLLAPIARGLPFVQSPDHPAFAELSGEAAQAAANHPRSRGLEGMALNTSGTRLYPLLEGAMVDDPIDTRLLLQEFDLDDRSFTGNYWFYPATDPSHAIGEITAINDNEFLVIERDSNQGSEAAYKRIYKVDLRAFDEGRTLIKTPVVDLLNIADVNGITSPQEGAIGFGATFSFPFVTIESVEIIDADTLLVVNDNNYPFSTGRRADQPDDNEFILVGLSTPLDVADD